MKRLLVISFVSLLVLASCATSPSAAKAPSIVGVEQILPFVHIDGFGTETDTAAWIAWEFEALNFVRYQVAYTSCTCRPESINARSLLYVEVSKAEQGGKIRKLAFNYWGDSPKMPSGILREEIEQDFMPLFVGQRAGVIEDVDVISGATVTTINLKQITGALLAYHNQKYPSLGMNDDTDDTDATSAATEGEW